MHASGNRLDIREIAPDTIPGAENIRERIENQRESVVHRCEGVVDVAARRGTGQNEVISTRGAVNFRLRHKRDQACTTSSRFTIARKQQFLRWSISRWNFRRAGSSQLSC